MRLWSMALSTSWILWLRGELERGACRSHATRRKELLPNCARAEVSPDAGAASRSSGSPLAYARYRREGCRSPGDHPAGHGEATGQGARVGRGFSGAFSSIPSVSPPTAAPASSAAYLGGHSYRSTGFPMSYSPSRGHGTPRAGKLRALGRPEPCGSATQGLPQCLLELAAGAGIASRDPSYNHRAPLHCCNVARASTGVTGAHMPGDKTRELWEHLRLPEIKAQLGLKMADSVTSTLRLQLMPVKKKQ